MKWVTTVDGKKKTHYLDSGVPHNPAPSTKRGERRKARREGKGK